MLGEREDVLGARTQGWELDGEEAELVLEVGVEASLLGQECEIAAAGGDHAHVDAPGPVAPRGHDEAVLDEAEECELEDRARGLHLIDEQAAAVCLADEAT